MLTPQQRYYQNNKKKRQAITQKLRLRNKRFLYEYLSTHPCQFEGCDVTDPDMLEFDHLRDKTKPVTTLAQEGVSIKRIEEEISKCRVLCANHHRKETYKQFSYRQWLHSGH
jgi:hypothetical protein